MNNFNDLPEFLKIMLQNNPYEQLGAITNECQRYATTAAIAIMAQELGISSIEIEWFSENANAELILESKEPGKITIHIFQSGETPSDLLKDEIVERGKKAVKQLLDDGYSRNQALMKGLFGFDPSLQEDRDRELKDFIDGN